MLMAWFDSWRSASSLGLGQWAAVVQGHCGKTSALCVVP